MVCRARMRVDKMKKTLHIDGKNALRTADGNVKSPLVGCKRHAKRLRGVTIEFVERQLDWLSHIRAEKCEGVCECATMFKVGERNHVLRMELCYGAQAAIGSKRQ